MGQSEKGGERMNVDSVFVVLDPTEKYIVRGVYNVPDAMSYEDAVAFIQSAYAKDDMPFDILEQHGIESVGFDAIEVSTGCGWDDDDDLDENEGGQDD